jgi:hypothetical protein
MNGYSQELALAGYEDITYEMDEAALEIFVHTDEGMEGAGIRRKANPRLRPVRHGLTGNRT